MQAKKHLGQNFLTDKNKVNEIINSLNLSSDSSVFEVGPGHGALTIPISKIVNNFIAIEIDDDLIEELNEIENLEVINKDVLQIDLEEIITKETIFVSNLPYYISTKILFKVMENENFKSVNVMMQKELVDRIYAKEGTKQYGRLSVSIRSFFDIENIIKVPRGCFSPAPNVDSAFINLKRVSDFTNDRKEYLEFIKDSFSQKRKKWLNSLKNSNSKHYEQAQEWIAWNEYPETIRAEQITVEQFKEMWLNFKK